MCVGSVDHQHESAIGMRVSPPSWNSLPSLSPHPTPQVVTEPQSEFPESSSKFPWAIYVTYGNVCFRVTLSLHSTLSFLSPTPTVSGAVLYVCLHPFLCRLRKGVYLFSIILATGALPLWLFCLSGALCLPWTWYIKVFNSRPLSFKRRIFQSLTTIALSVTTARQFPNNAEVSLAVAWTSPLSYEMRSCEHTEQKYTSPPSTQPNKQGSSQQDFS